MCFSPVTLPSVVPALADVLLGHLDRKQLLTVFLNQEAHLVHVAGTNFSTSGQHMAIVFADTQTLFFFFFFSLVSAGGKAKSIIHTHAGCLALMVPVGITDGLIYKHRHVTLLPQLHTYTLLSGS